MKSIFIGLSLLSIMLPVLAFSNTSMTKDECEAKKSLVIKDNYPLNSPNDSLIISYKLQYACSPDWKSNSFNLVPELHFQIEIKNGNKSSAFATSLRGEEYIEVSNKKLSFTAQTPQLYDLLAGSKSLFMTENTDKDSIKSFEGLDITLDITEAEVVIEISSASHVALGVPAWRRSSKIANKKIFNMYQLFKKDVLTSYSSRSTMELHLGFNITNP